MSYDINIGNNDFNITYNVADMFYKHNEKGIRFHYGKNGLEASVMLIDMYHFFLDNHEELKKLNPTNGWGSWSHTVDTLNEMIKASISNPLEIWEGDWMSKTLTILKEVVTKDRKDK